MLQNVLTAVIPNALIEVCLHTVLNHFVNQFEPLTTISSAFFAMRPYIEDLPHLEYPNLEDILLNELIVSRSDGAAMAWSTHGSTTVFGFSLCSARNIVASLCVYAAMC